MAEKENDPPFDAGAFVFHAPAGTEAPLLIDSPHSGRCYPENFHTLVPHQVLRGAEDWMVDDLFGAAPLEGASLRSEEHTSELQSLMRISYAVSCLKKTRNTAHTS